MTSSDLERAQNKLVRLDTKCDPGRSDVPPALSDDWRLKNLTPPHRLTKVLEIFLTP